MSDYINTVLQALDDEAKWVLFNDLQYQPELKLYQLITRLEAEVLRPRLNKLKAENKDHTADLTYQFFMDIKNAIYQAAEAHYIIDRLRADLHSVRAYNKYLQDENASQFSRLSAYESIEQLTTNQMLEIAINRVREKMKSEYQNTHSVTKQTTTP